MTPKVSLILSYAFLFLSIVLSHATSAEVAPSWSAFEFIKPLQGSKKGDKVEGLYNLKKYLKTFGYINEIPYRKSSPEADYFSDQMESAVKTYQTNFNLNSTGVLDADTISQMMVPRCGVPDIINGTNYMQRPFGKKPHYAFTPGTPRWPDSKDVLTYTWAGGTPAKFFSPVTQAFSEWFGWTRFSFDNETDYLSADLKFRLFSGPHGDVQPFDGQGGVLAHAFRPTIGVCHFDADETWVGYDPPPWAVDIQTVATHEIGHLLGLAHSSVRNAVMYPSVEYGEKKRYLADDDIDGIIALYPDK